MYRIGNGYDSHRFEKNRQLILGGVKIDYPFGLAGHSDADVLTHALIDSLLGASASDNIGILFPDDKNEYKDINSLVLLERTMNILREKLYRICNIDMTIICEKPKLSEYIKSMKEKLCPILLINHDEINIKPKSNEKMGFIGRGEGIAVISNVLITKSK